MHYLLRQEFRLPLAVLALLAVGAIPISGASYLWLIGILAGIIKIVFDSIGKIRHGEYSLDYIAFLAMLVALLAGQYLAGIVVALMITGGEALDAYASARAESALRRLVQRIPKTCIVRRTDGKTIELPIQDVQNGDVITVRPNELVPLDGLLRSDEALLNEANLTGEAIPVPFAKGSYLKSGAINVGRILELEIRGSFKDSTYMRIVHLVEEAKKDQAPVVRLAEKVNFPFTAITLVLAAAAYLIFDDLARALAVLVIATPCPLIIAAPVAFIGGLSRAARRNIIVKRPATLEQLTRVNTVFFDKTGTLTLGEPKLISIEAFGSSHDEIGALAIAAAIEFHSIHPLARTILKASREREAVTLEASAVEETIGQGISGEVGGERFTIAKAPGTGRIKLSLSKGPAEIARFTFEDEIKPDVASLLASLGAEGIATEILTGDKRENAERVLGHLKIPLHADLSPESKFAAIDEAKKDGNIVAMVGDGLNDAPALARADVGIVFSGTENSASIEAADAVILGHRISMLHELFMTARRSMRVAEQSIWGGITLSVFGMVLAALGFIPPVAGAIIQEVIDVVVILNSLRAAAR